MDGKSKTKHEQTKTGATLSRQRHRSKKHQQPDGRSAQHGAQVSSPSCGTGYRRGGASEARRQ